MGGKHSNQDSEKILASIIKRIGIISLIYLLVFVTSSSCGATWERILSTSSSLVYIDHIINLS